MKPVFCPNCRKTCIPEDNVCPYCKKTIDTSAEDEFIISSERILCEFCGSYTEPENDKCPNCGANLGESIRIQEEKRKKAIQRQKEKEEAKRQAAERAMREEQETRQMMDIAETVLTVSAGKGFFLTRLFKWIIRKFG